MDMGHGSMEGGSAACKISMLWNWYTVDSCFLSESWHVRSKGAFAGTVIGVFLIVAAIEGLRRMHRDYDRRLIAKYVALAAQNNASSGEDESVAKLNRVSNGNYAGMIQVRPTWMEQSIRGTFYGVQFTAAFLIMLMGMYYNGFVLFAIFLGGTAGYIIFGRDTLVLQGEAGAASGCCC